MDDPFSQNSKNILKFRCPTCAKLYSVDAAEIRTEKPQFECVGCTKRFWFSFPPASELAEVPTYGFETPAAQSHDPELKPIENVETFICIKCGFKNPKGAAECSSCGLVFEKSRRKASGIREEVAGNSALKELWGQVLQQYTDSTLHEKFIKQALAQKNLPFASQQYRQILEANPSDDIALKMREKIINIATLTYIPQKRAAAPPSKKFSIPAMVAITGVVIVFTGFVFTALKPIIPIGAFFCAIGLGIIYFSKKEM